MSAYALLQDIFNIRENITNINYNAVFIAVL